MRLCKDCRWMRNVSGGFGIWTICTSPKVVIDPVHGRPQRLCELARQDEDSCGIEGKHWERREAKRSFWQRMMDPC